MDTPTLNNSMQMHDVQSYSYASRQGLLPTLTTAFTQCGGWILERNTISASSVEFRIEIQLNGIMELYGSLVASELELTRTSHDILTALCTSRQHVLTCFTANHVVCIRLEVSFLEDVTLHSLLMTGCGVA
jgi:hypothetical protein